MKSEPDEFSIDDLVKAPGQTTSWFGVRNYQARNFMRDEMKVGDRAFFYHSSCPEPGIAGIVAIAAPAHPDVTQFDPKSPYYDPKSTRDDAALAERRREARREDASGAARRVARARRARGHGDAARGNRLSITPVTPAEWKVVEKLAKRKTRDDRRRGIMNLALIPIFLVLGAAVGFMSGLLGIGGGFTIVPVLMEVFTREGFATEHVLPMAIGTSAATDRLHHVRLGARASRARRRRVADRVARWRRGWSSAR